MAVCVFASSSARIDARYMALASELGTLLARKQIDVVFGGGGVGLMGKLADAVISSGGKITGVIPRFMKEAGWDHSAVKNMIVTEDMSERKRKMFSLSDSVIALPGGIGTLEELAEALTLKQLGQFNVPIVVVNIMDFYKPLFDFFDSMIDGCFMMAEHREMWKVATSPEEALQHLVCRQEWAGIAKI
ncbi:MAG: TIGR00730 family Rossman fold protein [Bacteroidales bacterium]|jgi:uncharacterized protein (TIGR00730 family)|nr:TIGR00730 family Rossman fold protein [Bacteroidales bacterium]